MTDPFDLASSEVKVLIWSEVRLRQITNVFRRCCSTFACSASLRRVAASFYSRAALSFAFAASAFAISAVLPASASSSFNELSFTFAETTIPNVESTPTTSAAIKV